MYYFQLQVWSCYPFAMRTEHEHDIDSTMNVQNEWYPRGIQISLHIRSPGLQAYGGEVFRSKLWSSQI